MTTSVTAVSSHHSEAAAGGRRGLTRSLIHCGLIVVVSVALAAACGGDATPTEGQLDLATARQRWAAKGFADYEYVLTKTCFCGLTGPVDVVVGGDSIRSATAVSDGHAVSPQLVSTISGLFDFIQQAIDDRAARIDVTYDSELGFPTRIEYDGRANIADDEVTFTASNVVKR